MRWRIAIIAAILAGGLALGPLAWLRGRFAGPAATVAAALAPVGETAAATGDAVLREQVVRLGAENALLRSRLDDYARIQGEGDSVPARVVVARGRIISRSRRTGARYVELDVGRVDGVARGMPVAMGWTLVGQVIGTDDGRCGVQLITDARSRIAAAVIDPGDPARPPRRLCEGVVTGLGRRTELALDFVETDPELTLLPGQGVVTAGADGRFPAGLVIGTIRSASHAGGEAWQIAVAPSCDPELTESLLVLRFDR